MKRIALFSIPAHGHTNPMIVVAKELVKRGNEVRFYSFREFEEKIKASGAEFVSCDEYLSKLSSEEEARLKKISQTEMTIQDIRITISMNDFLENEFKTFKPDVVYTDAVCFWGKLNAWKFGVPMVVSTSTFAFNQFSSKYMKNSPAEIADMIFGLPKISKALKELEPYGYKVSSALRLVQNDNDTDTVVYASRLFQPCAESYSDHYAFVGPSIKGGIPDKKKKRPLLYISMGTILNERPDLYKNCIEALKDMDADVVISCGKNTDISSLGKLPDNIKMYPYVDQIEVLSRADAFMSHCGMNSASESLYMSTPVVLFPQTGEQHAVARMISELGAGVYLKSDSPKDIRKAFEEILGNKKYSEAADRCGKDFRACPGAKGAAEFIENAPHETDGYDPVKESKKSLRVLTSVLWTIAAVAIVLTGTLVSWKYTWIIGVTAGILIAPIGSAYQMRALKKLAAKREKEPKKDN